ncbi:MAG: hypothetical protein QOE97_3808 [Pseudonocardiales bacterium]|jgi:hypothetical protein|nr:hypothetical protein [Pseudonocardiales bacterium]
MHRSTGAASAGTVLTARTGGTVGTDGTALTVRRHVDLLRVTAAACR